MSKSDFNENRVIDAQLGAGGITPANVFISLHTADPTQAGNQQSNEATFGGYARQQVNAGAGWDIVGDTADNSADITFPEASSGSETITHIGVGTALSGAGNLLYLNALTGSVAVSTGVTVKINAGNLIIIEQ